MASCSSASFRAVGDLLLGLLEVLEGLLLVALGLLALVLVHIALGPGHRLGRLLAGLDPPLVVELGELGELLLQLLLEPLLLLGELLELVGALLGVGLLAGLLGLLEVGGLLGPGLLELGLGGLELGDEAGQLALAAVLDLLEHLLEVATGLGLAGLGLAHLVLLQLLGGLAHLGAGGLLPGLLGGVLEGPGGERVGLLELPAHLVELGFELAQLLGDLLLAGGEVGQLGLLLGREGVLGLAHHVGPAGGLGRLLHRLLLLAEQRLGLLDGPPDGVELAQLGEHVLELVDDRLLVLLGLGQGLLGAGAWSLGSAGWLASAPALGWPDWPLGLAWPPLGWPGPGCSAWSW